MKLNRVVTFLKFQSIPTSKHLSMKGYCCVTFLTLPEIRLCTSN